MRSVHIANLKMLKSIPPIEHKLDVAARGHVFFQTVLELIYREVTTLGFV